MEGVRQGDTQRCGRECEDRRSHTSRQTPCWGLDTTHFHGVPSAALRVGAATSPEPKGLPGPHRVFVVGWNLAPQVLLTTHHTVPQKEGPAKGTGDRKEEETREPAGCWRGRLQDAERCCVREPLLGVPEHRTGVSVL